MENITNLLLSWPSLVSWKGKGLVTGGWCGCVGLKERKGDRW